MESKVCCIENCEEEGGIYEFDVNILELRARQSLSCGQSYLCKKHYDYYFKYYTLKQNTCCDPLGKHKKKVKCNLRVINDLQEAIKFKIGPGQCLCVKCYSELQAIPESESESEPLSQSSGVSNTLSQAFSDQQTPDMSSKIRNTFGKYKFISE